MLNQGTYKLVVTPEMATLCLVKPKRTGNVIYTVKFDEETLAGGLGSRWVIAHFGRAEELPTG